MPRNSAPPSITPPLVNMRLPLLSFAPKPAAVLVAFLLLLAGGCSSPPPPLPPLPKNAIILALGDSLTEGVGGGGISYPQHLQTLSGRTVINAGIRGETSAGARARAARLIAQHAPQLLLLCTGGNDFLRRQDADNTRANISAIIKTAHAAGVPVVLIAVPRIFPLPLNHPIYGDLADAHNLWIEDNILKTVLFDSTLKSDQIHANAAGYQKIAAAIAALLKKAGALNELNEYNK